MANRITVATLDQYRDVPRSAVRLCLVMVLLVLSIGCHREESPIATEELDQATSASKIDWSDDAPLVSAEWHVDGVAETDLHDIMHVARSDEFLLHLGGEDGPVRGRLKVWLVYADFFGARAPRTWPKAQEWAGGILAFFEIDWEASPSHGCRAIVRHAKPRQSTRFDWAEWVVRMPGCVKKAAMPISVRTISNMTRRERRFS